MVEALYYKNQPREYEVSSVKVGDGEDPFEPLSPSSGNGANGHCFKTSSHTHKELLGHNSLLELDVKFDLHSYDGELNVEKLDN